MLSNFLKITQLTLTVSEMVGRLVGRSFLNSPKEMSSSGMLCRKVQGWLIASNRGPGTVE